MSALSAPDPEDLRLEYPDMYLIHWPVVRKGRSCRTTARDRGVLGCPRERDGRGPVRGIGVSVLRAPARELTRAAPGNRGELDRNPPELPQTVVVDPGRPGDRASPLARGGGLLDHPAVVRVATRLGVTPAQAALRWNVQNGVVVIPKSVTPARIAQNADIFGFELGADDMDELEAVNDGVTTSASPWSDSGPTARRNRVLRPILAFVLRPFFWLVRVDVQRMGRSGFIRWAWSE